MGTTTNGLPWPEGTDLVVDGDDAIRALAEKTDAFVLPFGFARVRCLTAASHGASMWNTAHLDALTDAHGAQPWVLEASSRRIKILTAGVYAIQASLSGSTTFAVAIQLSSDGTVVDRAAVSPLGGISYTNSVSAVRHLAAGSYVLMQMYSSSVLNTVVDAVNTPSYVAIQALGGTAGILP